MNTIGKAQLLFILLVCITACFALDIDIVRLIDSDGKDSKSAEGTVEFLDEGEWRGICFNDFMKEDGGVVCRHLNFSGIKDFMFQSPPNDKQPHDLEYSCYGHEENLHKCHSSRVFERGGYACNDSTLYISCYNHSDSYKAISKVRLGGGNHSYGRVELWLDDWQTICGEGWAELEGGVVCRQLGFRGVKSFLRQPSTVTSTAKHKCNGYEMDIADCQTNKDSDDAAFESLESYQYSIDESEYTPEPLCSVSVDITCLRDIVFISPNSKNTHTREIGGNLTLRCKATNSTDVWWKLHNFKTEKTVGNSPELNLENISPKDQGSYVCVAKGLRGQIVESEELQTLMIPDYVQILLQVPVNTSDNSTAIGNTFIETFTGSGYDVFFKEGDDDGTLTIQLGKLQTTDTKYTIIMNDIDEIIKIIQQEMNKTSRPRKEGLSFCIEEPDDTNGAGILHFPSTNIGTEAESTESCVASETPRASRKCLGDLVTAAVWEDAVLRNCFNVSKNSTVNTKELVEKFFEIFNIEPLHVERVNGVQCVTSLAYNPLNEQTPLTYRVHKDRRTVLLQRTNQSVEGDNVTVDNVPVISRDLADITAIEIESATEEAIDNVTIVLERITNVKSPSPTVTRNVIETVDNVVNQSSLNDQILNPETSSTIVKSFEQQLDTVKESGSNFSHTRSHITVEVVQIKDKHSPIKFEFFQNDTDSKTKLNRNDSDPQEEEEDLQVSVQIPTDVLKDLSNNCTLNKSTNASNASESSLPVSFTIYLNGALFNDSGTNKERNSLIVSTSMLCEVSDLPNGTFITTLFSPTPEEAGENPWQCVFWNLDGNENGTGRWATEGCVHCGDNVSRTAVDDACSNTEDQKVRDPLKTYKCSWTHLTNFAVLLDVQGDVKSKALDVITIIGCVISIVSLLITISSHFAIKKLRSSQPKQIIVMLCITLLGLYLSFLIGINRTEHKILCVIFGGLIHFFCISSVAWMGIEATQLYLLLVKVINAHVRYFVMKAALIAWGIPFVVVVICVAFAHDDYAHDYCFPKHCSNVFYICVLGLVAVTLIYNIVMYSMIIRSLSASRKTISTNQTNRAGVIRRLQNAFAISVLLGLSWSFGFFSIGSARLLFNILFCLFNSFQGFFVFLLFCLRQAEIREAWRGWFGIAICLETATDAGTVTDKRSTSTGKHITSESDTVSKTLSKTTEKSENVELTGFKGGLSSNTLKDTESPDLPSQ